MPIDYNASIVTLLAEKQEEVLQLREKVASLTREKNGLHETIERLNDQIEQDQV